MTVHATFKKNQKIILMFKSKSDLNVIAKYKGKKSGKIFTSEGTFNLADLRSANIYTRPPSLNNRE